MERAKRIELSSQPWQGRVLPLNHARKNLSDYLYSIAISARWHKLYFAAGCAGLVCAVDAAGAAAGATTGPNNCDAMDFR